MNWIKRITANRKERKEKVIREGRISAKVAFLLDLVEIVVPVLIVLFCLGAIVYMLSKIETTGMDIVFDYIIAGISGIVLVVSVVNKNLSDRYKYIVAGSLLILAYFIGFIIVMGIALRQKDGSAARIISVVSLIISVLDELIDFVRFQFKYVTEKNRKNKKEIENLEGKSVFDKKFDLKN